MGLAIAGVIANSIAVLFLLADEYADGGGTFLDVAAAIMGSLVGTAVLGLLLAGAGKKKLGGILVIIGSVPFVPLGLIGAIGGRKIMQSDTHTHDLGARRHAGAVRVSSSAEASRGEVMTDHVLCPVSTVLAFQADRRANAMIAFGCVLMVVALVLMAALGGAVGALFTVSIVLIAIGIFRRSSVYLRFDADYFETKLALAAGWHTVLYSEVTHCEVGDKEVVVHYRKHGQPADAKLQRIRILLGELRPDDLPVCIDAFRRRLPSTVSG